MASLEEILAYKAAERAQEGDAAQNAGTVLGATGGSLLGMMAGIPVHKTGNAINAAKSMLGSTQGAAAPRNPLKALKPGYRMAGSLVGTILGGGLGIGTRQMAIESSPTARLLGKIQSDQEVTETDRRQLAALLEDTYSTIGLR